MKECEKCLKYPICIGRVTITCDVLQNCFDKTIMDKKEVYRKQRVDEENRPFYLQQDELNKLWDETWSEMKKSFPYLKCIYKEDYKEDV